MTSTNIPRSFYSVKEVCNTCGISKSFLYKLVKLGKGPALTKIGNRTVIAEEDLSAWKKGLKG